jgi:hypothetical protein
VEYLDNHEVNGYEVYLNNEPFISCVTSTHTPKERKKHNTCYTAAVVYIEDGAVFPRFSFSRQFHFPPFAFE